ncbi:hypothetical protein ACYOEI_24930 [Singulisphaera rosea]
MEFSVNSFVLGMKFFYLYSLVKTQVKFDVIRDRYLFLGIIYTAGVAFLFFAFIGSWETLNWAPWQRQLAANLGVQPVVAWIGETLLLSSLYFWLLARFDEGMIFWTLILLGIFLVYF